MGTARHAALDGSEVRFTADADLGRPMTAFGFVRPEGRSSQALNIWPAGKSDRVQAQVRAEHPEIRFDLLGDVEVNGGTLRMARVRRPAVTGGMRRFTFAVWEGSTGSITTSVRGDRADMEDLFDRLSWREVEVGIAVDSPVDESVRPLRCLKEVGRALIEVKPLTPQVTQGLPRQRGREVAGGELFRRTETSRDVLVITPTAAVYAAPLGSGDEHVALASQVEVEWGGRL